MNARSLIIGLSLLATGAVVGTASQQFAVADVSTGDRPVLIAIDTCRIVDTRQGPNSIGPKTSPLGAGDTMRVDAQQPGTDCSDKIPTDASSLSLNVTAVGATNNSFVTIWSGGERPVASALNPAPGTRVVNAATTELASDQTFQMFNDTGTVNLIVDVNGYYVHHDHDDRYYTQTQADAGFVASRSTIDLAPPAFRTFGGGWNETGYSLQRDGFLTGRRCIAAAITVPIGASVSGVTMSYWNGGTSIDAQVEVRELSITSGRPTGGEAIAAATLTLDTFDTDFATGSATASTSNTRPAALGASHQVEICTMATFAEVHGVQLDLS